MKKYSSILLLLISCFSLQGQVAAYKNPSLGIQERTQDLLQRMTLEEKVGQMLCPLGWEMYVKDKNKVSYSVNYKKQIDERKAGMFWATFRADPWTKRTLETGLTPRLAAEGANALQRYAIENTRLGIPVFFAEEAPHGHMAIGTTVFPTGIGQASTFNPGVLQQMGEVIGKEIRLQGAHIGYGPVMDLVRDARWSRVEETFGEDPVLISTLGSAVVKGMGAGQLKLPYSVISTLKCMLAYGVPESGLNGNPAVVGTRDLHENFLPPFKKAIEAGALSLMTSYNSIDGIPTTMNRQLLTNLLRQEWLFRGFTVSDLYSIEGIKDSHFVAETHQQAAIYAAGAGTNVDLGGEAYLLLIEAVRSGKIAEAVVDSAASHVLKLKFEMGLFENPYVDPQRAAEQVRTEAHIAVARKVAQQSVVLLENKNELLPLRKNRIKVAVLGPNADNAYNQLGDYTAPQEAGNVKTVLDGVIAKVGKQHVTYVKGCAIRDTINTNIEEAVEAARKSDVSIVVVGGSSARDFGTNYKETGAAVTAIGSVSDMDSGEGNDRVSLELLGKQMELLKAVKAVGKPMIVVYIQGRPLNMNWACTHADALLTAWYPGQEGGHAIADVLFGDYNPSGRLPISIPRHEGQIPCYYNKKNPIGHNYIEMTASPLYPFGYGKSYTKFEYDNLHVEQQATGYCLVSFDVKNAGQYEGTEVVQLYMRKEYASTVQPVKQLKVFEHVTLKQGETKRVTLSLHKEDFSIVNRDMKRVVEPGTFKLMIGASSDDIRLNTQVIL